MKILDRAQFLKLPAGVIYAKGKPCYFGELAVKGDTAFGLDGEAIDWWYQDLNSFEFDDTNQFVDRFDEMLKNGASYPLYDGQGRDGLFDADALFLVYEQGDLERLQGMVSDALAVTPA